MNSTNQEVASNGSPQAYIGRFAPSPSGPLHFGSLVAALASYLDARHYHGQWLVRIDDIDSPREVPGAADTILQQLHSHQLHWDGEVLYQSHRNDAYQEAIEQLNEQQLTYPCDCSRQGIKAMGGHYNGHCRYRNTPPKSSFAHRLHAKNAVDVTFDDLIQGEQCWPFKANGNDDFIVQRRDQLFAYQLACAVDDLYQGITHVVRGSRPAGLHTTATLFDAVTATECQNTGVRPYSGSNWQRWPKTQQAESGDGHRPGADGAKHSHRFKLVAPSATRIAQSPCR